MRASDRAPHIILPAENFCNRRVNIWRERADVGLIQPAHRRDGR